MKLAVTATGTGWQAQVDPRFGRAAYIVLVDLDTGECTSIDNGVNRGAAQGAGIQAGKMVVESGVEAVLTGHVGPKAFDMLRTAGVRVYTGAAGTVADTVAQYKAGALVRAESADVLGHWV
jgi:predicted Fe-Mo cluster-binding NifX family protein